MELTDVPVRVVISEYIDVAHAFFEGDEPRVVNGVLDQLARKAAARRAAGTAMSAAGLPWPSDRTARRRDLTGEDAIIALLAPLTEGFPGAFGLKDDCALLTPAPGTELVLKTDPIAEGVHFLADDAPQDIAWKALAVNVSDLAAKGAAPLGYLMALSFPAAPALDWMTRFADGLRRRRQHFGCHLMGGDTDRRPGPLTISITVIGSVPEGSMVRRATARAGDAVFVSGTHRRCGARPGAAPGPRPRRSLGPVGRRGRATCAAATARPEPRLALAEALRAIRLAPPWTSPTGWPRTCDRLCGPAGVAGVLFAGPAAVRSRRQGARRRDPGLDQLHRRGGTTTRCWRRCPRTRAPPSRPRPLRRRIPVTPHRHYICRDRRP